MIFDSLLYSFFWAVSVYHFMQFDSNASCDSRLSYIRITLVSTNLSRSMMLVESGLTCVVVLFSNSY